MKCRTMKKVRLSTGIMLSVMLGAASALQSCSDDLLSGQPSWLGNSIYEQLEEDGHYKTTLKLIEDLGLHEVLSHTGSKTLFVADDDAYKQWFQTNTWGVHSYEQLSLAQKKLLFNNSMVNNAYLIELLSNVSGNPPQEGKCMRRATAASVFDSLYVMRPADMPETDAWQHYRVGKKDMLLLKDATTAPMIHFLPAYMQLNKITSEDLSMLTNGKATSADEAWINGRKVIERDITCKNGYIQKVDGTIEAAPNMAEILRQHPAMSQWSKFIDRFSAPYYNKAASEQYKALFNKEDSVFTLRYYSDVSQGNRPNVKTPDGEAVGARLAFDPGWNQYMYTNTMGYDMHYDAGAMIVPTNAALADWWAHDGKVLQDKFGSWDQVPDDVLAELLNVNMLGSFSKTVPSKFGNIMNDAKVPLGITKADVDSCFMGCNGAIYMTHKVFGPSAYSSVSFPALINKNTTMGVVYWGIDKLDFKPYLNSMDSYYSLLLPSNDAMLYYVDPCSYGETQQSVIAFRYDNKEKTVKASRYNCAIAADGTITLGRRIEESVLPEIIQNRLSDMMNNLIIAGNVEDGHEYYKTKGGSFIQVKHAGSLGSMSLAGGWQLEHNQQLPVQNIYDMSKGGNGKSYVLDTQMPLGASKSVYETLKGHPEYSEFFSLITGGDPNDPANNLMINTIGKKYSAPKNNYNVRLFDTYNYTVYVPTNAAIRKLITDGVLPTWEDFERENEIAQDESKSEEIRATAKKNCTLIKNRIMDFVRYHIQDNSVIIGGAPEKDSNGKELLTNNFESMKINPSTGRFYSLKVENNGGNMTITDMMGHTRKVNKTTGLYNNICREYWFTGNGNSKKIYTTSDAVVHQIDGVLWYDNSFGKSWRQEAKRMKNWK